MRYIIVFGAGIVTGVFGLLGSVWLSEERNKYRWPKQSRRKKKMSLDDRNWWV
jgi:hypothetical protein